MINQLSQFQWGKKSFYLQMSCQKENQKIHSFLMNRVLSGFSDWIFRLTWIFKSYKLVLFEKKKKNNKKIINEKFYAEFIKGFGSLCERVWSDSGSAVYSPLLRFEIFIISIEKNQILIKLLAWKNQCDLHCRFSSNKYLLMIFKFAWCLCHCKAYKIRQIRMNDKNRNVLYWTSQTFTTKKKTQF